MEFKDKLRFIMNKYSVTAIELSRRLDVQRSNISHLLSGRNKPSIDFIIKLKHCFSDLNYSWLLEEDNENYHIQKPNPYSHNELPNDENIIDFELDSELKEDNSDKNVNIIPDNTVNNDNIKNELNDTQQSEQIPSTVLPTVNNNKSKLQKVLFMYEDGSFEIFDNRK
jgi:transcriptional regulator with XRE-family HTH domain